MTPATLYHATLALPYVHKSLATLRRHAATGLDVPRARRLLAGNVRYAAKLAHMDPGRDVVERVVDRLLRTVTE